MSEYTPDTEEVRIKYRLSPGQRPGDYDEFDRWLAEVKAEAAARALIDFADSTRMPFTVFRGDNDEPITVGDLLRETAAHYDKEATDE
jgi:hypothetical protein